MDPFTGRKGGWMVKHIRIVVALATGLLLVPATGSAQSFAPNSIWTNQTGARLTIESIAADGSFTGSLVNRGGDFACRNAPYHVSGWIDGQKIAFSVRWTNTTANCQSITTWNGFVGPKGLQTQWVLVYLKKGDPTISSGKDLFH
jgi:avidin family protein